MSRVRVGVVGAAGRLGSAACAWIDATDDLDLVARVEADHDMVAAVRESGCEVALDVTRAPLGHDHAVALLEAGVRPVIGTSGVDVDQCRALDDLARARGLGGLVVPNFSLGALALQRAAELAAQHFARFEVLEMHHERKHDAPSGTARYTADRLAEVAGLDPATVPIHSVRLPGAHSNQEVVFGGEGEWLRLRHETYDLASFRAGLLAALRYAVDAVGVARGLGPAWDAEQVRRSGSEPDGRRG